MNSFKKFLDYQAFKARNKIDFSLKKQSITSENHSTEISTRDLILFLFAEEF